MEILRFLTSYKMFPDLWPLELLTLVYVHYASNSLSSVTTIHHATDIFARH
jgi:hypothetical protein